MVRANLLIWQFDEDPRVEVVRVLEDSAMKAGKGDQVTGWVEKDVGSD